MDPQEFLAKVNENCPELLEPSWVPQISVRPNRPPIFATKIGCCTPWVSAEWSWPQCNLCCRPTSFLLQINLADLPKEFKTKTKLSGGLLQVFDCTGCSFDCTGFGMPRIVPQKDLEVPSLQYLAASSCPDSEVYQLPAKLQMYVMDVWFPQDVQPNWDNKTPLQVFKESFVIDFKKNNMLEIPHKYEWSLLEAAVDKFDMDIEDIENINYKKIDGDTEIQLGAPSSGTKLGGWFDWDSSLGYPGYPKCSKCSGKPRKKTVLMQFSIFDLLPEHEFGQLKSRGYPDFMFVSICPFCQNPSLFESFPPPLI